MVRRVRHDLRHPARGGVTSAAGRLIVVLVPVPLDVDNTAVGSFIDMGSVLEGPFVSQNGRGAGTVLRVVAHPDLHGGSGGGVDPEGNIANENILGDRVDADLRFPIAVRTGEANQ